MSVLRTDEKFSVRPKKAQNFYPNQFPKPVASTLNHITAQTNIPKAA